MRTFYLGIGAQKAGTSWLFNQLKTNPNFVFCAKEMHTFDVAWLGSPIPKDVRINPYRDQNKIKKSLMKSPKQYFDFYDELMVNENSESGDFTPEYCNLKASHLDYIKNEFKKRGIKLKVVFLMREPVSRIASMMKMRKRNSGKFPAIESLIKQRHGDAIYSNYKQTVTEIDCTMEKQDVFYAFYELMFFQEDRIAKFFNLDVDKINVNKKWNASTIHERFKFTKKERKFLKEHYAPQYEFISQRFGSVWKK